MNFRKLHRKIAPVLFLPLLLSALTGMAYRLGRSWFGLGDEFGGVMMTIHQGEYLGKLLVPVYLLLLGLGLIGIVITGLTMLKFKNEPLPSVFQTDKFNPRLLHRFLAPIFFLPFFVSAFMGIFASLGEAWFGLSDQQVEFFLDIHQGNYLGKTFRALYILSVGLGLLLMLYSGIQMTNIFRRKSQNY